MFDSFLDGGDQYRELWARQQTPEDEYTGMEEGWGSEIEAWSCLSDLFKATISRDHLLIPE